MSYKKWNTYLGWLVFLISTAVYFVTIEDTVSLWDCGEYITAAYKLEVGHPPGAPLFMVLGRLFSFFADPENVAVWINRLSAVSSSLTILFMFWSLTLLVKKMLLKDKAELSTGDQIAVFGSAIIGSLAYAFSESFWFSAVEGEVYAMSSLFTAAIFWAILKWDEEMAELQGGKLSAELAPNRWLLLIMFLLGLAIGVHLLGILVVPAIAYIVYFRYGSIGKEFFYSFAILLGISGLVLGIFSSLVWLALIPIVGLLFLLFFLRTENKAVSFFLVGILSVVALGFIQEGVIPGSVSMASSFEVAFVNSLGLPFFSGTLFFFAVLTIVFILVVRRSRIKGNSMSYNMVMGLILLLIGYGSFAVIVIRSNANTPLDENDPENLVTLHAYLKREQYGSAPLLYGPHWNSTENDPELFGSRSPFYLRRFVVTKGDQVIKAFKHEANAKKYAQENGGSVEEKYFESNATERMNSVPTYAQNTFFPRMYWNAEKQRVDGYIKWSGYDANDGTPTEKGNDGKRLPTFGENMQYFMSYQVNWMYWRYFMWNFSGRQNDIQGHGDNMRGNWISGFGAVDNARLGDQGEAAPYYTTQNPSNNKFYFLPLILGLVGMIFHFYRAPKDAFVVFLAFLFTGLAIVVYLNQKPFEPRERDYAYAGSFYFFALWIGVGVYALYDAFRSFEKKELIKALIIGGGGLLFFGLVDSGSEVSMPNTISWIIIAGLGIGAIAAMMGLKKVLKSDAQGATVATLLGLFVPVIMGMQGWDDHDRSLKTSADDLALNYLESCAKNSILFTNGDNDTFPLWYMQEVEEKRTDVRVCNLSLMQTDWYTDQMKMRAYDSDPLPIKFREDQILMYAGYTDQVIFTNLFELFYLNASDEILKDVIKMRVKNNAPAVAQALEAFNMQVQGILTGASSSQPNVTARIEALKVDLTTNKGSDLSEAIYAKYRAAFEILSGIQGGLITLPEGQAQAFQDLVMDFEKPWDTTNLKEAMEFVRDDKNLIAFNGTRLVRVFPSTGFILPVNADNAVKSGVITAAQKKNCHKELRFNFEARGLTREQVMMLDVLANNDWKRGIYFSSPGGSDVSVALYTRGYVKQNGMAFELSPLNEMNNRFSDKMYANLMSLYKFGAMNNPDVLTDYYTRRHTAQYRLHFASLADDFLLKAAQEDDTRKNKQRNIEILRKNGMGAQAAELEASLKGVDERIADYKKKAQNLIKRSLEVMPADVVIDYGEPNPNGREKYTNGGIQLNAYSDGILHDYVVMLYKSGDKKSAEALAVTVADQLESIFNYFEKSDVAFSASRENTADLYAAMDAYFKMYLASIDPEYGNANGALAKRLNAKINDLYKNVFPKMYRDLETKANNNGESTRRGSKAGKYASMLFELQDYIEAIGVHYGYLEGKPAPPSADGQEMDLQQLMQQMPVQDTTKP